MSWASLTAHSIPQLECLLQASGLAAARALSDAILASCSPHSESASKAANAELKRRAR